MQNKKRIPADDKVPYERWVMPDLTGVRQRIAQRLDELQTSEGARFVEPASIPDAPAPEALQALRDEARQQGYAEGLEQGRQEGHEDGRATGYQEGEQQGQEAGFQAGYQRGLEQSRHEVDQQLARLQGLIEQLQGPLAALDHDVEAALLSLVDLVCRSLLRREITLDRSFLSGVLAESVAALPAGHQRLRIFLNPDDLPLAEAACEDLLEDYRLIGDPAITLGGARVETLQSLVDSTLENRYKKIIDQLLGDRYQQAAADLKPLPQDVLSTPDSQPLASLSFAESPAAAAPAVPPEDASPDVSSVETAEVLPEAPAAVSEPDAPVPAVEPESAVASPALSKVSLQRGGVPRNVAPVTPPQPEATTQQQEPSAGPLTEADEDAFFEQAFDALLQPGDQAVPALESEEADLAEAELDSFLEGFADVPDATEPGDGLAADAEERVWAPDSVHDARYDVFADTWMDDLNETQDKTGSATDEQDVADDQH